MKFSSVFLRILTWGINKTLSRDLGALEERLSNPCLTQKKKKNKCQIGEGGGRRENEKGNGECLGDVGPALQPVSEHLQTGCQGSGKYQVLSKKQCSEANEEECWGSKIRAPALEGWGKPDRETRAQPLSGLVHMGDLTPVHCVQGLSLSQRQEYMS